MKVKSLSRVRLFSTAWTAAYQAPPPMRFSRQEYWSGLPSPSLTFLLALVIAFLVITNLVGMKWYLLGAIFPLVNNKYFDFSLSCIGEGNGSPLQCSCGESQGQRSLVGCRLWGHTESDTTDAT